MEQIKLTSFSHGAGCGCKIAPKVLDEILKSDTKQAPDPDLLIGNDTRDDAAVYSIDEKTAIISTTDFFMPVVDDPHDFGGIAAVNAISDVYAMGGKPLMAISILGWPVDKISTGIARQVVEGARDSCSRAGIPLAGGHSIDTPEPIFGLAVTGIVEKDKIKSNSGAIEGCELFLTKPLGIGILTTALKRGVLNPEDLKTAVNSMLELNRIGEELSRLDGVKSMTDVSGFGFLGHLIEMCEGSGVSAEVRFANIPVIERIHHYIAREAYPGGTYRNFNSYGEKVNALSNEQKIILCDPQTSGGLLLAVHPSGKSEFLNLAERYNLSLSTFGRIIPKGSYVVRVI